MNLTTGSLQMSSFGWDEKSKREELFHRFGRLIVATVSQVQDEETLRKVIGFCSFRFDREEDIQGALEDIVYWYVF